jgi:hypothetical protein
MPMAPASLPHLGLVLFDATPVGQVGNPAPFAHMASLGGFGPTGNTLIAAGGTYSISGQAAGTVATRRVAADAGFLSLLGQPGLLNKSAQSSGESAPFPHMASLFIANTSSRTLVADPGIYSILGSDSYTDHELDADFGSLALTGYAANLNYGRLIAADYGQYAVAGQDAGSMRGGSNLVLNADSGAYSWAGVEAGLIARLTMLAEQGFYARSGTSAELVVGFSGAYKVTAEAGAYSLTGGDSNADRTNFLRAESGNYTVDGMPVTFTGERWPDPATVLAGVFYGPNGNDFVGTMQPATEVWAAPTRTLTGITPANVKQVNDTTITGTGTAGDPWGP